MLERLISKFVKCLKKKTFFFGASSHRDFSAFDVTSEIVPQHEVNRPDAVRPKCIQIELNEPSSKRVVPTPASSIVPRPGWR